VGCPCGSSGVASVLVLRGPFGRAGVVGGNFSRPAGSVSAYPPLRQASPRPASTCGRLQQQLQQQRFDWAGLEPPKAARHVRSHSTVSTAVFNCARARAFRGQASLLTHARRRHPSGQAAPPGRGLPSVPETVAGGSHPSAPGNSTPISSFRCWRAIRGQPQPASKCGHRPGRPWPPTGTLPRPRTWVERSVATGLHCQAQFATACPG